MKKPRILMVAIVILFVDILLWASLLPASPLLNIPFKAPNLINGIGLIGTIGLMTSIFTRSIGLRKIVGIIVILTHIVLIIMAYLFAKYDHGVMAFLIAGISLLVVITTLAMLIWRPLIAFFEYRANA